MPRSMLCNPNSVNTRLLEAHHSWKYFTFLVFVSKHPVVVNQMVIDNNSVLHTNTYNAYYKNTLHVSTLKVLSSGAKSNKLNTLIQKFRSSQTNDNNDTII
jgi:ankyrin repeat protein